jgi:anaerobic selenocysteine-containing dehydrogenase
MSNITACPLDCYDACAIYYADGKFRAIKEGHTLGFLCPHMNHYDKVQTITQPRYRGQNITLNAAMKKLQEMLSSCQKSEVLHYRGHGNFALMQEVTDHFFASFGATLTDGTLCDGAGEAGILEGRGSNKNMPLSEIAKSEVVIVWGRNPHTSSSHLLPLLKGKKVIVIDPVRTKVAKSADLFLQLKPKTDLYLALLIVRFLYINDYCNESFVEKYASELEEYYELTQTIRIKSMLENMGISLGQIGDMIELIKDKKVAIVCGVGIQKYRDGADTMRAIDSIAVALGLFGKEGCGVAYLGESKANVVSPFNTKAKRVSKVNTMFEKFKTVFIQGSNPLSQMPDSLRVKESLSQVQNIVYFGLYENETSEVAELVIPAKSFLHKDDIRTSYSHHAMLNMPKVEESEVGISEYELSASLCSMFEIEIKEEQEYLKYFKNHRLLKIDGSHYVEGREDIPYKDGFDTDDGEFIFLEEVEIDREANKITLTKNSHKKKKKSDELYLITSKSPTSLNSQFERSEYVYLHSSHGYEDGSILRISSTTGSVELPLKVSDELREDCILIYSGTRGVNNLTSCEHSYEGKSAVYQENRVVVEKV